MYRHTISKKFSCARRKATRKKKPEHLNNDHKFVDRSCAASDLDVSVSGFCALANTNNGKSKNRVIPVLEAGGTSRKTHGLVLPRLSDLVQDACCSVPKRWSKESMCVSSVSVMLSGTSSGPLKRSNMLSGTSCRCTAGRRTVSLGRAFFTTVAVYASDLLGDVTAAEQARSAVSGPGNLGWRHNSISGRSNRDSSPRMAAPRFLTDHPQGTT